MDPERFPERGEFATLRTGRNQSVSLLACSGYFLFIFEVVQFKSSQFTWAGRSIVDELMFCVGTLTSNRAASARTDVVRSQGLCLSDGE